MGQTNPVDTGIPQGSPAAPILLISYLSGISFVDGIAWWAEGKGDQAVASKLSEATAASLG